MALAAVAQVTGPAARDAGLEDRDAALVSAARAGDRSAQQRVLEQVGPVMLATARQILRDSHDAEDLAQEAMMIFIRDLHLLRDARAVFGFARRLTARLAIRARQRRRLEDRRREQHRPEVGQAAGERRDVEAEAAEREHAELLLDCLERLPPKQAEAFLLRCVHDYSLRELAEVLEAPQNTVKSRIRLAKAGIRRLLRRRPELGSDWGHGDGEGDES